MKYYIIAGEASGDLHGSNLIKELKLQDKEANIRCWGGDLMQNAGGTLVKHYKEMAFMGFLEVLLNLNSIFKNIKSCKEEKEFYEKKHGFQVNFVGHPLLDAIANRPQLDETRFREAYHIHPNKPIVALLPGSRKQEVQKMLAVMLSLSGDFQDYEFVIAGAPSLEKTFYASFLKDKNVAFVPSRTYDLLSIATAALVTSGTATLETALFKVPQVVCYKANWISYQIAKRIITLEYISLVNLIMDKEIVKELLQNNLTRKQLKKELSLILSGTNREKQLNAYSQLNQKLGGPGASKKAASLILSNAKE